MEIGTYFKGMIINGVCQNLSDAAKAVIRREM